MRPEWRDIFATNHACHHNRNSGKTGSKQHCRTRAAQLVLSGSRKAIRRGKAIPSARRLTRRTRFIEDESWIAAISFPATRKARRTDQVSKCAQRVQFVLPRGMSLDVFDRRIERQP